jgi:DNA repair exonuclease SbcCD ATPase subunit
MKKIEFLKQGLENFCNHIEPLEIDFTKGSITMITGPNGIGKTSIFQAIAFTLYGQCEKGRGDDVLNNKTGKNCHTWTIFKLNDELYRVDRYVKYTRLGNSVTITKGDSNVPYLKGHKEVVPEIEKLLMPFKLFNNTLLFSQKVKTFFTDLGDAEQKEIFRKILTLDDIVLWLKQCGLELKDIEEIVLKLNQDIGINKGLLESAETRLKENLEYEKTFNKNRDKRIYDSQIQVGIHEDRILLHLSNKKDLPEDTTVKQQIISTQVSILRNDLSKIDDLNNTNIEKLTSQANLKISELNTQSLELSNKNSDEMRLDIQKVKDKYDVKFKLAEEQINLIKEKKRTLELESTKLNSKVDFLETEIINLDIGDIKVCPTCQREVDEKCIDHLGDLVQLKVDESGSIRTKIIEISKEFQDLMTKETSWNAINKKDYDKCQESIKALQEANRISIGQFTERKNIAINKVNGMIKVGKVKIQKEKDETIEDINKEISELSIELSKLVQIQTKIDEYNQQLNDLQLLLEGHKKESEEAESLKFDEATIDSCKAEIYKFKDLIKNSLSDRVEYDKKIKIINFWKVGFSSAGIQSMLIDEAIPFMNERMAHYMGMIAGGRYTVTFDTLKATKNNKEFRDKISVNVFDSQTHSDKRVKFSGGQTRLVDIGTILTLSDLMANVQDVTTNIILFDEIFDSLDSENISYASGLIRTALKDKWVGIISHNKIDDIEADNILEFR